MYLGLEQTASIVGGGSAGMGLAIGRLLAAEGSHVTLLARGEDGLREAAGQIKDETGEPPLTVAGDVRDPDVLRRAVDATVERWGRLDVLVNNAGGPRAGAFEELEDGDWQDAFDLSFRSAVRLTRLALPHLRASGRGRIVNITSSSVREPIPGLLLSNAIRPGVVGWAKTLSRELAAEGITVNTIAPGLIDTARAQELWASAPDPEAARREALESIPAGRPGSPDEIAAAVGFLCSTAAAYVSGVVLPVDGAAMQGVW